MSEQHAAAAPRHSLTAPAESGVIGDVVPRVIRGFAGLICLAVCATVAANHPLGSVPALSVLLAYVILLARAPNAWLALVPALLPVAALAPWTGWLYLDEFDLILLASLSVLLLRGSFRRVPRSAGETRIGPLDWMARLLVGLLAVSYGIALLRGLLPLPAMDSNAFASYESRYNAARIFKGFAAALAFWPFLSTCLRENETGTLRLMGVGLASGLALACLAGIWERLAFLTLADFASDYRITGSFWEMHTGGAALDGFLALTVPFAVWALSHSRRPWQHVAAGALLAVAGYVVLVTFTRTTYIAIGGGLLLVLLLRWRAQRSRRPFRWTSVPALVALSVVVASPIVLATVFASSGYRGLAAVSGLWAMTFLASPFLRDVRPREYAKSAITVVALAPLLAFVVTAVPKGPYFVYAGALAATVLAVVAVWRGRPMQWALAGTVFLLALSVLPVATYWGGRDAAPAAFLATMAAVAAIAWHLRARQPLWALDRATLTAVATLGIIVSAFAVTSGSYLMTVRFGQSTVDLSGRIKHWTESLSALRTPGDWMLGVGLGRYPDVYFWTNATGERPGAHAFIETDGNISLGLSGPRYAAGYGEIYRFAQRVRVAPAEPLVASVDVRAEKNSALEMEVCEKHLLYWGACRTARFKVAATGNDWKHLSAPLPRELGRSPWYAPRLLFFIISNSRLGTLLEVDNVRLHRSDGTNILANGDFTKGMNRWFFTSDRHHLAWHIKNIWLNYLFEQGIAGLTLFIGVLGIALYRVTIGTCRDHPFAPYLAGSLVGFCVTGMFDTLVDVTRIAFLFYVLTFVALLLPEPRRGIVAGPTTTPESRTDSGLPH